MPEETSSWERLPLAGAAAAVVGSGLRLRREGSSDAMVVVVVVVVVESCLLWRGNCKLRTDVPGLCRSGVCSDDRNARALRLWNWDWRIPRAGNNLFWMSGPGARANAVIIFAAGNRNGGWGYPGLSGMETGLRPNNITTIERTVRP